MKKRKKKKKKNKIKIIFSSSGTWMKAIPSHLNDDKEDSNSDNSSEDGEIPSTALETHSSPGNGVVIENSIRKWKEKYRAYGMRYEPGTYTPNLNNVETPLTKKSHKQSHSIGSPFNLSHTMHIDSNFTWSSSSKMNPNDLFAFSEELGKG